uniref:Uncharacterized protein n=1 Tax=Anguilla anguilla TaxID=7936 RepID=A0A0E9WZN4_ANGAN
MAMAMAVISLSFLETDQLQDGSVFPSTNHKKRCEVLPFDRRSMRKRRLKNECKWCSTFPRKMFKNKKMGYFQNGSLVFYMITDGCTFWKYGWFQSSAGNLLVPESKQASCYG